MLKRVKVKKLGRSKDARRALYKSMARQLLEHGAIETSEPRAKALRGYVDRLLKESKDAVNLQRRIVSELSVDRSTASRLSKLSVKEGSKTRIIRIGKRSGDGSLRVRMELLVSAPAEEKTPATKTA